MIMKKLASVLAILIMCLAFCGCGKTFSTKVFDENGIYADYSNLSVEEQEKFLAEAVEEGYSIGMDNEGRVTLRKDGKTYVLGESKFANKTEVK